jgi:hypothetical protein
MRLSVALYGTRARRVRLAVALAAVAGLVPVTALPTAAAAAGHSVYTVGTGADLDWRAGACVNNQKKSTCSLRAAITQANMDAASDLIRVPPLRGGKNYQLSIRTGPLKVTTAMTITGPGSDAVAIDAGGLYSALAVDSGSSGTVSVIGLDLFNGGEAIAGSSGLAGGLYVETGSTVRLNDVIIRLCRVTGPGGGILNKGNLQLSKVTVSTNSSGSTGVGNGAVFAGPGGGINNVGTLTMDRSTVDHNDALRGGGINNSGTLTMSESTVSGNTARNSGGGIRNSGTLNIKFSTIANNWADSTKFQQKQGDHSDPIAQGGEEGGGIANLQSGVVHVSGSIIATNHTWLNYDPDPNFGTNAGSADCYNTTAWAFVSERNNFWAFIDPRLCNVQDVREGQVNGLPTHDFVSSDPHQSDDPELTGLEYVGTALTAVQVPADQGFPYVIDGAYDPIVTPWFVCDGYDQLGNLRPVSFYGSADCDTGSVEVQPGMALNAARQARTHASRSAPH